MTRKNQRFQLGGVGISITHLEEAANALLNKAREGLPGYICVTNVRAAYTGKIDSAYADILSNSYLTVPDGKPLEWLARLSGNKKLKKTSGPDLLIRICELSEHTSLSHYFYGSTPEVIKRMKKNLEQAYPGLNIVGAVSPDIGTAEELAKDLLLEQIVELKPSFVWVGLGAPKQERFINLVHHLAPFSTFVGIGLAFDYQAGTVKRAPGWMQKSGLEWLYRDIQQPRRFFSFVRQLFYLIQQATWILWKRIT